MGHIGIGDAIWDAYGPMLFFVGAAFFAGGFFYWLAIGD